MILEKLKKRRKRLDPPLLMGILNFTPDSFSDGGVFFDQEKALEHCLDMVEAGAYIIDIGGESTRPGSEPVSLQDEAGRTIPLIRALRKRSNVTISIDTYKAEVAKQALNAGANMVNDISGLTFDSDMGPLLAKYDCPVIVSHIQGTPRNMQKKPFYVDVLQEIKEYFLERLEYCDRIDVNRDNVILDTGIGFGKRLEDNLKLVANPGFFEDLGQPLLYGTSRKSFIGQLLDEPDPRQRETGSMATFAWLALAGVDILRVHDVKKVMQFFKVLFNIKNQLYDA
ncbi:dihydropteroate synthase [bacterium]|nr:dihydropteroate synthase [bacterium]